MTLLAYRFGVILITCYETPEGGGGNQPEIPSDESASGKPSASGALLAHRERPREAALWRAVLPELAKLSNCIDSFEGKHN
eukprot:3560498-Prorocentrum_lima.AAC.1